MTPSNITQYPTVHLNGTSKDTLLNAYTAANSALLNALEALEACAPNGRDYYVSGDIGKATPSTTSAQHPSPQSAEKSTFSPSTLPILEA